MEEDSKEKEARIADLAVADMVRPVRMAAALVEQNNPLAKRQTDQKG